MSELTAFNPTKRDLLNIESLILDIKAKKNNLVDRKMKMEHSIANMFDNKRKRDIKKVLHEVEIEIKGCNEELNYKNKLKIEVEHHLKNNKPPNDDLDKIIIQLNLLRVKYFDFAKDRTRVASLRIMANEFITELDKVLKNK